MQGAGKLKNMLAQRTKSLTNNRLIKLRVSKKLFIKAGLTKSLLLLVLLIAAKSHACSCIGLPTLQENINNYERILLVELEKSPMFFLFRQYNVIVREVFKGDTTPALKSLRAGGTSCDERLSDKDQWLVFLKPATSELKLGWCGPHRRVQSLEISSPAWRELISDTQLSDDKPTRSGSASSADKVH